MEPTPNPSPRMMTRNRLSSNADFHLLAFIASYISYASRRLMPPLEFDLGNFAFRGSLDLEVLARAELA